MLKRFQVLLEDWQADHMKEIAEAYDLSFSEVIRIALSLGIVCVVKNLAPEFQTTVNAAKVKDFISAKTGEDERHKMISDLYYESRKASEIGGKLLKKDKTK